MYANSSSQEHLKRPPSRSGTATPIVDEEARYRVDAMERHLANLTGLVQQALAGNPPGGAGSGHGSANSTAVNSRRPSESTPRAGHSDYANVYIAPKRPVVLQKGTAIYPPSLPALKLNGPFNNDWQRSKHTCGMSTFLRVFIGIVQWEIARARKETKQIGTKIMNEALNWLLNTVRDCLELHWHYWLFFRLWEITWK